MSRHEQRRALVLTRLLSGGLGVDEAARSLDLWERSVRRLRARMERDGPAGLVHGNRGRSSPRRLDDATRERILELAEARYADLDDTHLAESLAEEEGSSISRAALQRLLRMTENWHAKSDLASGTQVFGFCKHPIVRGSGTGDFEGVRGRLDFRDDLSDPDKPRFIYKGHLKNLD